MFATAAGVRRIDPAWLEVARNLGARPLQLLTAAILPAVAMDVLTGIRLALGVAWVALAPAEHPGVASGLGFATNDARDTLDHARLMAALHRSGEGVRPTANDDFLALEGTRTFGVQRRDAPAPQAQILADPVDDHLPRIRAASSCCRPAWRSA